MNWKLFRAGGPLGSATLAATLALTLSAPAQDAVTADTVMARVNGTEITLGHMVALRDSLPEEYLALPPDVLFQGVLEQLIQQTALATAREGSITPRDEAVMEIERRAYLAGAQLSDAAAGAVTDADLRNAYEARFADAAPTREYHAAHIIVETEEEAVGILEELEAGGDFAGLARLHSTDGAAMNGGDLGWFPLDVMVEPFGAALAEMEPGEIEGPVETQFGWHVVQLIDTRLAETPTLDEVRPELEAELRSAALETALSAAVDAVEVERSETEVDPSVLSDDSLLGN